MAASVPRSPDGTGASAITGINVTPLVDITLVLLIIFLVTAKLMVSPRSLNADLPRAATGTEVQEIFSVVLLENGRTRVDGVDVAEDGVRALAKRATARGKTADLRAVINADGAVPHRRVMRVLDLLRQAGVAKVGFGVVPAPPVPAQPSRGR
jgi:biopolymer transport protein ExbD